MDFGSGKERTPKEEFDFRVHKAIFINAKAVYEIARGISETYKFKVNGRKKRGMANDDGEH